MPSDSWLPGQPGTAKQTAPVGHRRGCSWLQPRLPPTARLLPPAPPIRARSTVAALGRWSCCDYVDTAPRKVRLDENRLVGLAAAGSTAMTRSPSRTMEESATPCRRSVEYPSGSESPHPTICGSVTVPLRLCVLDRRKASRRRSIMSFPAIWTSTLAPWSERQTIRVNDPRPRPGFSSDALRRSTAYVRCGDVPTTARTSLMTGRWRGCADWSLQTAGHRLLVRTPISSVGCPAIRQSRRCGYCEC